MQDFKDEECLCEMIQLKEKLKVVEYHQKILEFKEKLGLDPSEYIFDEQEIISILQIAFEGEIMRTQCCVQKKDLIFTFLNTNLGQKLMNMAMQEER